MNDQYTAYHRQYHRPVRQWRPRAWRSALFVGISLLLTFALAHCAHSIADQTTHTSQEAPSAAVQ